MMLANRNKKLVAGVSALSLLFSCTACSTAEANSGGQKVAVICKSADTYWDAVKQGIQDVEAERNVTVMYSAPEKEDYEKQIDLIHQAVNDGAQVLVIAPVVREELNDTLKEVIDKGIPVITIDSDVSLPERTAFIGTQNVSAAESAGEQVKTLAGDNGTIAILTHDSTSQSAQDRTTGFQNAFTVKTEGIQLLEPADCGGDEAKTKETAIQLITENPEINFIYATNRPTTVGACQAVESMIKDGKISEGQVQVVGFDYFDGADAYLNQEILAGVILQNPYNMGYFGVTAACYLLDGESIPVSMMDTGTEFVTKDNLNDENIQFMLKYAG